MPSVATLLHFPPPLGESRANNSTGFEKHLTMAYLSSGVWWRESTYGYTKWARFSAQLPRFAPERETSTSLGSEVERPRYRGLPPGYAKTGPDQLVTTPSMNAVSGLALALLTFFPAALHALAE